MRRIPVPNRPISWQRCEIMVAPLVTMAAGAILLAVCLLVWAGIATLRGV